MILLSYSNFCKPYDQYVVISSWYYDSPDLLRLALLPVPTFFTIFFTTFILEGLQKVWNQEGNNFINIFTGPTYFHDTRSWKHCLGSEAQSTSEKKKGFLGLPLQIEKKCVYSPSQISKLNNSWCFFFWERGGVVGGNKFFCFTSFHYLNAKFKQVCIWQSSTNSGLRKTKFQAYFLSKNIFSVKFIFEWEKKGLKTHITFIFILSANIWEV